MYRAHKAVVKAIVQARLPAMGHIPLQDQQLMVRLMYEQELSRRQALFPHDQTLGKVAKALNTQDFEHFWRH